MAEVCVYAQVHQPWRLSRYSLFDIGSGRSYFDDEGNAAILRRVASKCYLPANALLRHLIAEEGLKVALSLTCTVVEQLEQYAPEVLESFQQLVAAGGVELLGETSAHSLAAVTDPDEFLAQVDEHRAMLRRVFGARAIVFRNTELIWDDGLAPLVKGLGFEAALVEGADRVLAGRSPNHVYAAPSAPALRLLPRNYGLSDDVGFRFSERSWVGWPLTAERYADWLAASEGESVQLYIDYETIGEHQWAETGIFEFVAGLPAACAARGLRFVHPAELAARAPVDTLAFTEPTSWADVERDLSAWLGNGLQRAATERLYRLGSAVLASGDDAILRDWRRLTSSDHVYYLCTKAYADGDVHAYFSPYDSPHEAYMVLMNVLQDLEQRCAALACRELEHAA